MEEIKRFSKNVSIRYVPKLIFTKDSLLRIFWIICFLASLAILIWQLFLIFNRYFSYPRTTQYSEDINSKITFPEFTICNQDPMAEVTNPPFTYQTVLDNVLNQNRSKEEYKLLMNVSKTFLEEFYSFLGSQRIYTGSLDSNVADDDRCPRLVVDCRLYDQYGAPLESNCSEYLRPYWSAEYYSCTRVRVPSNRTIGGIIFILYVRNSTTSNVPFHLMMSSNNGIGARIMIHNPGELPDYLCGINVGPSTDNTVILKQTNRYLLSSPYSPVPCTTQAYLPFSYNDKYSSKMCWDACLQDKILKKCGCFSHIIAVTDKMLKENRMCGNLTCGSKNDDEIGCSKRGLDDLMCSIRVFDNANDSLTSCPMCLPQCSEVIYDYTVISSPWPHPSYYCDIHSKYVHSCRTINKTNEENFYDQCISNKKNESYNWFNSSDKNHFIQVGFLFKSINPFVMEDKPAFTADAMLSQFGGCLGLWMGIGVTTLVEFLELFYIYIIRALGNRRGKTLRITMDLEKKEDA